MYSLLIVDDEYYALEAMKHAVDWSDIGFDRLYSAMSADEAREVLTQEKIDIMICDIEMPEEDGLSLQSWVREHVPQLETIFLTGHAEFSYAQKAIQMHSFDYLLKPIQSADLIYTVKRALEKKSHDDEFARLKEQYLNYLNEDRFWSTKRITKFWKDLYSGRSHLTESQFHELKLIYHADVEGGMSILPILFKVEEWLRTFPSKDLDILEFGLSNAAEEIVLSGAAGHVILDQRGYVLVLLQEPLAAHQILEHCKDYIVRCSTYLSARISCCIGNYTSIWKLPDAYKMLMQEHRHHIAGSEDVYYLRSDRAGQAGVKELVPLPWIEDIAVLLATGKIKEVLQKADELIDWMQHQSSLTAELLESFYHALLHTIIPLLHKNGIALHSLYSGDEPEEREVTRSIQTLRDWAHQLITRASALLHPKGEDTYSAIEKVCLYIDGRLEQDLGREELAEFAELHPAYLSRLFKKEKGLSISEYIAQARIAKAKELLCATLSTVTDIASKVGYYNYQHFTKMFKKHTGVTPQQYRRQHSQNTEGQ
ncbi:response regulator transcription factor [Paenibacillus urinalis]|uniref:response regulator transcription factor n=1 Tax=Paenibacillus urinalis TaxID=521520 RepID=UPI0019618F3D